MDEARKKAYRYLLYAALLEIRCVQGITYRPRQLLNPFELRRRIKTISRAGALADWLHNLAQLSSKDFHGFDEEWFWRDYERMVKRHGDPRNYRWMFDEAIAHPGHTSSFRR